MGAFAAQPEIPARLGAVIRNAGAFLLRYGLVVVLVWIGGMKFTAYEAEAIRPLIATSPLMGWMYQVLSVQAVSTLIGTSELGMAFLIAIRPISPQATVVGSALAAATFLTTLTFLVTLPGWEPSLGGFPALSGSGGFLVKDIILLGASVWSLGEALEASRAR